MLANCRLCLLSLFISTFVLAGFVSAQSELTEFPGIKLVDKGTVYRIRMDGDQDATGSEPDFSGKQVKRKIVGTHRVDYCEKILQLDDRQRVKRLGRYYELVDYKRTVDDQEQFGSIRAEVRKVVINQSLAGRTVFSPGKNLNYQEMDMIIVHHPMLPLLEGIVQPGPIKVGAEWNAPKSAVAGMLTLAEIKRGEIVCRLNDPVKIKDKEYWQVELHGVIEGLNKLGETKDEVQGAIYLGVDDRRLRFVRLKGTRKQTGTQLAETSQNDVQIAVEEVTDEKIKRELAESIDREPNEDELQLGYENSVLGIRFTHPKDWVLREATGRQLPFMTEDRRAHILVSVEDAKLSRTVEQHQDNLISLLRDRKIDVIKTYKPMQADDKAADTMIGHYSLDVKVEGVTQGLDGWVVRKKDRAISFVLRAEANDINKLSKTVENAIRTVEFSTPQLIPNLQDKK